MKLLNKPDKLVEIEKQLGIETTCTFVESKPEETVWKYDNRQTDKNNGYSKFSFLYRLDKISITIIWPLSASVAEKDGLIFDFEPAYKILNILLEDEVVAQDIMATVWGFAVKKRKTRIKNKNIKEFLGESKKYDIYVTTDGYATIEFVPKD